MKTKNFFNKPSVRIGLGILAVIILFSFIGQENLDEDPYDDYFDTGGCYDYINSKYYPCNCDGDVNDCDYFFEQEEAQECLELCKCMGKGDIHHLDDDNDGIACESGLLGAEIENAEESLSSKFIKELEEEYKANQEQTKTLFKVTRIIDGDTIEISGGDRVRLICIDTPEQGEEGYSEATNYLKGLILNENVELIKDISETDRYGRLLRYIYLGEDTFVNELIVYNGYGKAYTYSPDTSKCSIIQQAEQHAKNNNLGIWEEVVEEEDNPPPSSDIICSYNYYNCGDFLTCSEVMEVFNACGSDIHYLDGDDDGIPCESLCG